MMKELFKKETVTLEDISGFELLLMLLLTIFGVLKVYEWIDKGWLYLLNKTLYKDVESNKRVED